MNRLTQQLLLLINTLLASQEINISGHHVYLYSPHPTFKTLGNGSSSSSATAGIVREGGRKEGSKPGFSLFHSPSLATYRAKNKCCPLLCFARERKRETETVHGLVISLRRILNILPLVSFLCDIFPEPVEK